ncbi:MAG: hypothetical protein ACYC9O_20815, partial [Candidatus Latescibacterota bacterium]
MKKFLIFGILACMFLGFAGSSRAWDGERRGFILGFGLGSGLTSYVQTVETGGVSLEGDRENVVPIASNFLIGYAPTNQWQIFYTNKASWFGFENVLDEDITIAHGVGGIGVARYFAEYSPSFFLSGSVGLSTWDAPFEEDFETWTGFGVSLGWGYEFASHFQVENSFSWGRPEEDEAGAEFSTDAF